MNLACGPNRELFDFLAECGYSERIEALCVDIDSDALRHTNQHVNIFPHRAAIRLMSENVIKWAIGRVRHHIEPQDIIYSSGLCDYLDPRLFRALITRCHEHLKPGGTLLLGNSPSTRIRSSWTNCFAGNCSTGPRRTCASCSRPPPSATGCRLSPSRNGSTCSPWRPGTDGPTVAGTLCAG
jgi:hypothetical protein